MPLDDGYMYKKTKKPTRNSAASQISRHQFRPFTCQKRDDPIIPFHSIPSHPFRFRTVNASHTSRLHHLLPHGPHQTSKLTKNTLPLPSRGTPKNRSPYSVTSHRPLHPDISWPDLTTTKKGKGKTVFSRRPPVCPVILLLISVWEPESPSPRSSSSLLFTIPGRQIWPFSLSLCLLSPFAHRRR